MPTSGSLFSGIGGFDLGFERAGIRTVWQVELEPFCSRILEKHFPHARRFSDVRSAGRKNLVEVDCVTAGVPCQDVSVAGRRAGLKGERTGLFYEFARILQELRPAWFVFENVPGLFSSNHGRDFAEVLRVLMVECGYGVSWRVLDSRYFNVAQRRERVFIVGRFGKPCPPEILFESESGERNTPTSGEARQDIAVPLTSGSGVTRPGRRMEDDWNIVSCLNSSPYADREAEHTRLVAATLRGSDGHHGRSSPRGEGCDNIFAIQDVRGQRDKKQNGIGISEGQPMYSLTGIDRHAVAFPLRGNERNNSDGRSVNLAYALREDPGETGQGHNCTYIIDEERSGKQQQQQTEMDGDVQRNADDRAAPDAYGVRDFTGLPEGMDSPRYRALGNAVTATVAEWLGKRMMPFLRG